jgi:hypothetical protein
MFLSGNSIPPVSRELTEKEDRDIYWLGIAGDINPLVNASAMVPHRPRLSEQRTAEMIALHKPLSRRSRGDEPRLQRQNAESHSHHHGEHSGV